MGDCCRDAHPFRFCSGLRLLGYTMILLVAAIVAVSYYAVIVVAWGPHLLHGGLLSVPAFAIVFLFHLLLVLLLWSYFMVVFHDPGAVPVGWQPLSKGNYLGLDNSVILEDHTAINGGESEFSSTGGSERRPNVRYCSHCQNNKPPRCHHCSVCQKCVLKMDHHCVWVVNCVGARNYKFFLLFLFYTFLETVLDSLALLPHFIKFFGDARDHSGSPGNLAVTFISFVLNVAFALSLLCFVIMHTSLVLSNTTTIEVYEKKNVVEWTYDLGKRKNFEQKEIEAAEINKGAEEASNDGWFGGERAVVTAAVATSMAGAGLLGWWACTFRLSHQQMWMVPVSLIMFGTPIVVLFSSAFATI